MFVSVMVLFLASRYSTVAPESVVVGVTVRAATAFVREAQYRRVSVSNSGWSNGCSVPPELSSRPERVAMSEVEVPLTRILKAPLSVFQLASGRTRNWFWMLQPFAAPLSSLPESVNCHSNVCPLPETLT